MSLVSVRGPHLPPNRAPVCGVNQLVTTRPAAALWQVPARRWVAPRAGRGERSTKVLRAFGGCAGAFAGGDSGTHPQSQRLGSRSEYRLSWPRVDFGRGEPGCVVHDGTRQFLGQQGTFPPGRHTSGVFSNRQRVRLEVMLQGPRVVTIVGSQGKEVRARRHQGDDRRAARRGDWCAARSTGAARGCGEARCFPCASRARRHRRQAGQAEG